MNEICHLILATGLARLAEPVWAYIGPGTGLTAIGTVLAFVAIVSLLLVGFFWYPLKRLLRRIKSGPERDAPTGTTQSDDPDEESDRARGLP